MEVDQQALFEIFVQETEERLSSIELALLDLEHDPDDRDAVAEVFRAVHTIKGDAAMVGAEALEELAHRLEDLLVRVRDGEIGVDQDLVSLLLRAGDALRELLVAAVSGENDRVELLAPLQELLEQVQAEARGDRAAAPGEPARASSERELPGRKAAAPAGEAGELKAASGRSAGTSQQESLRVPIGKLDRLLTLVGEIAVSRSQMGQLLESHHGSQRWLDAKETYLQAERLHDEVQEVVMQLRMVPVGPMLRQYARTVRDAALELGRQAELVVLGGNVELDNSQLQMLRDPLTHLIRNAVDHGIEPPEERLAAGKPPTGVITITAVREGSGLLLELHDDGRGVHRNRVLERARALGLVRPEEEPGDRELFRHLFAHGFTTATEVTNLSGRGVGMDIVRKNIETLRGVVTVESSSGLGTSVQITIPLTLTIIDGLRVDIAGSIYVVPLGSVVETIALPPRSLSPHHKRGMARLHGRTLQLIRLRSLFEVEGRPPAREVVVVVTLAGGEEAGVVVDRVSGKSQTVIKPLAKVYQGVAGVSGSAILGDGRVALVVDIADLLDRVHSPIPSPEIHPPEPSLVARSAAEVA